MILKDLIADLQTRAVDGDLNIDVSGITYDSRQVKPGDVFVAIPGFKTDGAKFALEAVKAGAVAIVSESPTENIKCPQIVVPGARQALAVLSNRFYDFPSRKLKVIGVTGTNGKTTICYLLEHILKSAGISVGLIGTVETKIDGQRADSKMTTPESSDLNKLFASMVKLGVTHVVMEVSSHSLALDRVLGIEFDVAVFTNLTHDHLDFHRTMDEYFKAKFKLFSTLGKGSKTGALAVVNKDDPYSKPILDMLKMRSLTFGLNGKADLVAKDIKYDLESMTFSIESEKEKLEVETKLPGRPNVYNILASMLSAMALGLDIGDVLGAVASFGGAPGRYERVEAGQAYPVIVDFAHSPDSLQKLIETYRPLVKGKVILVFGCPGDRDREKRPMMGGIAARLADRVIITTDDPHSEDPARIVDEIEIGIERSVGGNSRIAPHEKIVDRREAIKKALSLAQKDDIVLVAGRGHEKFQDFNGRRVEIDDREAVKELLHYGT